MIGSGQRTQILAFIFSTHNFFYQKDCSFKRLNIMGIIHLDKGSIKKHKGKNTLDEVGGDLKK